MKKIAFATLLLWLARTAAVAQTMEQSYQNTQAELASGWHTYNHQSVLSHVWMPGCFSVKLSLKSNRVSQYGYMGDAYISTKVPRPETVTPQYHAPDGSFTELILAWDGNEMLVQSGTGGDDLVLLVTPQKLTGLRPSLIVETGLLWNKPGSLSRKGDQIVAELAGKTIRVSGTQPTDTCFIPLNAPYLSFSLQTETGICTGKKRTLEEIKKIIRARKEQYLGSLKTHAEASETVRVIHNAVGWNTTYDPLTQRVVSPVSRYWTEAFGGSAVLFDWDTYFGAYLAAFSNKALAFSNAIAITKSLTPGGFVPNYTAGGTKASLDRSQPPVGSLIVLEIYKKHPEKWFVQYVFDDLLTWNRWWLKGRNTPQNWLCWGSDPKGDHAAGTWQAAAYESGLDNSPMYDQVPFDTVTHRMALADVGLTSLYVADCKALAELADIVGRTREAKELRQRAGVFSKSLQKLWNEEKGIFLNKRTDTGTWNYRLAPPLFYPLLAGVATPAQANRMVRGHLLNPDEFWGEWVLPSVARNDAAFSEQDYWRGRIWAPLNFLVYMGLKNYDFPEVRKELADKSNRLLLKNWQATHGVYENYHASGVGRLPGEPLTKSDNFYHWGALLGYMYLLETGKAPQK